MSSAPKSVERLFPFALRAQVVVAGREALHRLRRKLHFVLITRDLSAGSREKILSEFAGLPVIEHFTVAETEQHFHFHNAKVLGFKRSELAASLLRELKEHRVKDAPEASEEQPAVENNGLSITPQITEADAEVEPAPAEASDSETAQEPAGEEAAPPAAPRRAKPHPPTADVRKPWKPRSSDRPAGPRPARSEGDFNRPWKSRPPAAHGDRQPFHREDRPQRPWQDRDRAPRADGATPQRPGGYAGGENRPWRDRPSRDGDAPRPWQDRKPRAFGDRPQRPWQDRDRAPREGGTGPQRPGGYSGGERRPWRDRPSRDGDAPRPWQDRKPRAFGDRPQRPWQDRDRAPREGGAATQRPWQDRKPRDFGDRPQRPWQQSPSREGGFQKPWQSRAPGGSDPRKSFNRADGPRPEWRERPSRDARGEGRPPFRSDRGERPWARKPFPDRAGGERGRPYRQSAPEGRRPIRSFSPNDQPAPSGRWGAHPEQRSYERPQGARPFKRREDPESRPPG